MTTVHWTPEAKTRLRAIEAYIAKDTSASAHAVVQRILARTRQLNTAPFSGRQVAGLSTGRAQRAVGAALPHHLPRYRQPRRNSYPDALPAVVAGRPGSFPSGVTKSRRRRIRPLVPGCRREPCLRGYTGAKGPFVTVLSMTGKGRSDRGAVPALLHRSSGSSPGQ